MLALVKMAPGPGNVQLVELPKPAPGPGQILAEVVYAGICTSDLHLESSDIQLNVRTPVVMGHEFSGRIVEIGPEVEGFQLGQPVVSETAFSTCGHCLACLTGNENVCGHKELLGYVHPGVFTEYVVLWAQRVHRVPEGVSLRTAVLTEPLACAVRGLYEQVHITPGDVVVVAGVGTMGLLCAQLAKVAGATVVVTGLPDDQQRLAIALKLGADSVVDVVHQDLQDLVLDMTGGEGADVYVECSGAPAAVRMGLELTRRRGQYLQVGLPAAPIELDFGKIAYRELEVRGTLGQKRTAWQRALKLLAAQHVITGPLVTHTFPLTEWRVAFDRMRAREGVKVVLVPGRAEA
jgi:L-iditol 2-dehydrogenase